VGDEAVDLGDAGVVHHEDAGAGVDRAAAPLDAADERGPDERAADAGRGEGAFVAQAGGETGGFSPMQGSPFGIELTTFLNPIGMPCWNPPYGSMAAYDLKTGAQLWDVPFGQVQQYGFYMPESWGSVTIGGPVITASGLVFAGASMDSRVRALDLATGKVLWKGLVDAPAVALPAVYSYKGRQYVVFVAGGNSILSPRVSDQVIAFALPG
jgi:quinoprotein glucose dehydrogenase